MNDIPGLQTSFEEAGTQHSNIMEIPGGWYYAWSWLTQLSFVDQMYNTYCRVTCGSLVRAMPWDDIFIRCGSDGTRLIASIHQALEQSPCPYGHYRPVLRGKSLVCCYPENVTSEKEMQFNSRAFCVLADHHQHEETHAPRFTNTYTVFPKLSVAQSAWGPLKKNGNLSGCVLRRAMCMPGPADFGCSTKNQSPTSLIRI